MIKKFNLADQFTNVELERNLLTTIASNPELYWEILDTVLPEAFTENKRAFEEMADAIEHEKPLPKIEGGKQIPELLTATKTLANLYQKRLLADLLQVTLDQLRSDVLAPELISQVEQRLVHVQQAIKEVSAGKMATLSEILPEVLKDLAEKRRAVKEHLPITFGLPSGIKKLDKLIGCLQTGLHLLAAQPGEGKTTLVLQIGMNVIRSGYPVLFLSFEESLSRLALKAVCQRTNLKMKEFAEGRQDLENLEDAVKNFHQEFDMLYLMEGNSKLTLSKVKAKALQAMARKNTNKCLIIVDYLQRWASSRHEFSDFRHVVSALVSELRELALRLDSPVLAISSQNREGQGRSNLTSLKESGELEYSADSAMFLVGNEKRVVSKPLRAIDLALEKNRYGDKGLVELIFNPEVGVFLEEAKHD